MGKVYGVSVSGEMTDRPRELASVSVGFGCAPENVDSLVRAVFDEIAAIKANGIADEYVTRVREARRRSRELAVTDNRFWLQALEFHYQEGLDPREIAVDRVAQRVTAERIQEAARRYLDEERYVLGVLRPQDEAAAARP